MKKAHTLMVIALMGLTISASAQGEVKQRQENQKARVQQGVNNGTLSRGQAHQLNQERNSIHNEAKADRAQNGGRLTPTEKKQINGQQNQVSKQIYNEKH